MQLSQRKRPTTPPTILIAAANQAGAKARKMVLEEKGYHVVSAHKSKDALQQLEGEEVSLLIVDFNLEHGKGLELIDQVADLMPTLPTILLADAMQALSEDLTDCRANMVIPKQFDEVSQLLRAVEKLLRRRTPRKRPGSVTKPNTLRKHG